MLNPFKKLLGKIAAAKDAPPQDLDAVLRLASAVLIAEVVRSDLEVDPRERDAMRAALHDKFGLPADDVQALVEHAEQTARDSNDLFTFTSQVNAQFATPQKLVLLEHLWRVAYANGEIDDHERHIVRRIADLMHVPQGASQGIRQRVAQESGAANG
jgi:uncharacterized tellurite resistance protein B-like protein